MNKRLAIVGASGHGKVIADMAKKLGYTDIVFFDDNETITECNGYAVVGTGRDVSMFSDREFVVAIGNAQIREKIQRDLEDSGHHITTLIHPNAVIGENVALGAGTVRVGKGCIINTCASVDHDCLIGDFVHVSVGAHVAGSVKIGARTWVGAGATVSNNIAIRGDCMVGAGAVVIKDINEPGAYIGVPARRMQK